MNITTTDARRAIRIAVAFVALLIAWLLIAGECAFDCGRLLRLAVHDRSEQLAALHLRLLGLTPSQASPQASPAPAEPVESRPIAHEPTQGAPAFPEVLAAPLPLETLTVSQLRQIAKRRGFTKIDGKHVSKIRKADLLIALAA